MACALGHVPMLLSHPDMSPWLALLMAVVALACLGCVRSLAFGPTRGTWLVVLTLSLTMVALHAPMVLSGHGHSAESQAVDPASSTSAHGEHGEQGGHSEHGGHSLADRVVMAPFDPGALVVVTMGIALVQATLAGSVLARRRAD